MVATGRNSDELAQSRSGDQGGHGEAANLRVLVVQHFLQDMRRRDATDATASAGHGLSPLGAENIYLRSRIGISQQF